LDNKRLSWDNYFLSQAYLSAVRSHDSESKVGCVLVKNNRVISSGYNGFPSGSDDGSLPSTRPDKYPFMVHAEENAIANMLIKEKDLSAYITRMPCFRCAKSLWQNDIRRWFVPNSCIRLNMLGNTNRECINNYTDDDYKVLHLLLRNGLEIRYMDFNYGSFIDSMTSYEQFFTYGN
jgi:deoxycytidylate deaminase